MSFPKNPLNFYRSYAYHHILIACDSTQTAENLATQSEITLFDHERADKKFCPQPTPDGTGYYTVLINGMSDSQFNITSAKWSTVIFPEPANGEGSASYRTLAVDGEIEILEPMGINFLNVINEVTKSLGTDVNGVCYMLKTIFVGHTPQGTTETITNVRPLLFIMYDISSVIDVTGSMYTLSLVGVVNGATRLNHMSAIVDGFSLDISGAANLEQAFLLFTTEINNLYDEKLEEINEQAFCSSLEFDFDKEFIPVRYQFELDTKYSGFSIGDNLPAHSQEKGDETGDGIITTNGTNVSIDNFIDKIMRSSADVISENAEGKEKEQITMYKISSFVDSSPEEYTVQYRIHQADSPVQKRDGFEEFAPKEGEGIVFDYIFTGKNIDILEFDIKMQYGMTFLQTLAATPSTSTSASDIINHFNPNPVITGTGNLQGSGDGKSSMCENVQLPNSENRGRKPLFLGMSFKDSRVSHSRNPAVAASYEKLLDRHVTLENLEAKLKIRGNLQLLEEGTQLPSDVRHDDEEGVTEPKAMITGDGLDQKTVMRNIHKHPAFVKVNVMMPSDFIIGNDSSDYAVPFWYQGWFYTIAIDHIFDNGEFTQELDIMSIPIDDGQSKLSSTKQSYDQCIADGRDTSSSSPASSTKLTDAEKDDKDANDDEKMNEKTENATDKTVFLTEDERKNLVRACNASAAKPSTSGEN